MLKGAGNIFVSRAGARGVVPWHLLFWWNVLRPEMLSARQLGASHMDARIGGGAPRFDS